MNKVSILGQDYEIMFSTSAEDPKLKEFDGYCKPYEKKIIIDKELAEQSTTKYSDMGPETLDAYTSHVFRHEILHAFFEESGITYKFSKEDEDFLVDWIARQFPKMLKVFEQLGVIK